MVFFGVSIKVYVAKLQRKLFGIYRSHEAQREAHNMARNVCSEEREILLSMIKDFVKVTKILDQKQQKNVAVYQDFQAEMSEGGFWKLCVTITLKIMEHGEKTPP